MLRPRRASSRILSEQGPRLTEIHPEEGDEVEVLWQQRRDGRIFTIIGRVEHVDPDRPKSVRLEGYTNYREFLRIITRRSTSMISNDTQSSSEYSDSQYY